MAFFNQSLSRLKQNSSQKLDGKISRSLSKDDRDALKDHIKQEKRKSNQRMLIFFVVGLFVCAVLFFILKDFFV